MPTSFLPKIPSEKKEGKPFQVQRYPMSASPSAQVILQISLPEIRKKRSFKMNNIARES
jgi:hypothetical protein